MKTLGKLLTIGIASLMLSCIIERKPSVELCNCIHNPQFQESNQLSQECIGACIEFFGEDLEGMEDWFKKIALQPRLKGNLK